MAKPDLFADMRAREFGAILGRLDLSPADAARLLDLDHKMIRLYASGYSIPQSVAIALRLLDQHVPADQLGRFKRTRGRPPND